MVHACVQMLVAQYYCLKMVWQGSSCIILQQHGLRHIWPLATAVLPDRLPWLHTAGSPTYGKIIQVTRVPTIGNEPHQ
jgi:hypothetical protein